MRDLSYTDQSRGIGASDIMITYILAATSYQFYSPALHGKSREQNEGSGEEGGGAEEGRKNYEWFILKIVIPRQGRQSSNVGLTHYCKGASLEGVWQKDKHDTLFAKNGSNSRALIVALVQFMRRAIFVQR